MKKLLSTLLITVLTFSTFAFSANTMALNSDSVTFFESMENMQNLDSYSITQNFSGIFTVDNDRTDDVKKIKGQFNFRTKNSIVNQGAFENDLHSTINGRIGIQLDGEDKPFDNLTANIRAEIIMILDDGIYVQLKQARFNANGVPKDEMEEYLEAQEEFKKVIDEIKGQWIYIPEDIFGLEEELNSEHRLEELLDEEAILEQLRKKGIKETIKELAKWSVTSMAGDMASDEEVDQMNNAIDKLFETKFFTSKNMIKGRYKNFTRYTLSKRRILLFIQSIANDIGEPLSDRDIKEIKNALSKFYLSGMVHVNNVHRIFDQFKLKFILHDIEELKNFRIGYFYKVGDFNKIEPIVEPDEFTSYENVDLSFLDEL